MTKTPKACAPNVNIKPSCQLLKRSIVVICIVHHECAKILANLIVANNIASDFSNKLAGLSSIHLPKTKEAVHKLIVLVDKVGTNRNIFITIWGAPAIE